MSGFLSYDPNGADHRNSTEEWQPHRHQTIKTLEWWYVTGLVYDTEGNPYFFAWCPIHMVGEQNLPPASPKIPPGFRGVLAVVGFADYHNKLTINDTDVGIMNEANIWDSTHNRLSFEIPPGLSMPSALPPFTSMWSYNGDVMDLEVSSSRLSFKNFHFEGAKRVMYAQDKLGINGFIQQGSCHDRSYYYALPCLSVEGTIAYTEDKDGKQHEIKVKGDAWVDRQWGDFTTMWWEWSSLRFTNGARVDLYSFCNDYKVGTYQDAGGSTPQWFDDFTLSQTSYIKTPMGQWLSWGWIYEFKDVDIKGCPLNIENSRRYTLVPWSTEDVHEVIYSFFEGPSDLYDEKGNKVGYAVTESMDIRHMLNAPIEMRRKCMGQFPP